MPTPTEQFVANPFGFAKKHGIMAPGEEGDITQYKPKPMPDGSDSFHQVSGGRRIQWLRLSLYQNGAYLADISTYPGGGEAPLYYLPWNKNQVVRMTLRHSQKAAGGLLDTNGQPIEPDIFLTAAVNGCSVFIEGPPDQPTVYHANAAGDGTGPNLDEGDAATVATRISDKATEMRQRYQAFSTGLIKADAPAVRATMVLEPCLGSRRGRPT